MELMGCYDGCVVRENIPYRLLSRRLPVQLLTEMMIYCMSAPHFLRPFSVYPYCPVKEAIKPQKCTLKNTADAHLQG